MSAVVLQEIYKRFGAVQVVHGIDLKIDPHEFVVLVGPSGCGKSTTLRMIAGLEEVSEGTITIDGRVVNRVAPKDRDVAMVFQDYALYPHLNVAENIAFGLRIRRVKKDVIARSIAEVADILGLTEYLDRRPADLSHRTVRQNLAFALKLRRTPRTEIVERVSEVANVLGLENLLDRYPRQLSGGQRQRVAMGRAMVRQPRAFLFDEPLSNLDAKLRVQMRSEIKELHQRVRTTFVYVTHDQVEAMTLADEIIVLNEGRIEQIGAPLELYDQPANLFVAGFIGSPAMNFVEGTVETEDDSVRLVTEGELSFPLRTDPATTSERLTLGFRPEHIKLAPAGGGRSSNAVVRLVEHLGHETLLLLDAAGVEITALLPRQTGAIAGDRVAIEVDSEHLHFFAGLNGDRLE